MTTDPITRSDAHLVGLVATGDTDALAALYDRHADAIFRAAYRRLGDRQLAEEVLQDTYLALWNRAQLYDEQQGSLLAWLGTIARNRAIDRMRAAGRRPPAVPLSGLLVDDGRDDRALEHALGGGELLGGGPPPMNPEDHVDATELRDRVREALARIPMLERRVLELAYFEELTQAEIATRLGWPLGTVKTRTRRGLLRLRTFLVGVLGPDIAPAAMMLGELDHADAADDAADIPAAAQSISHAGATDGSR
jgi:RNA polymerase sigma-70 factor (ECF subfamily)